MALPNESILGSFSDFCLSPNHDTFPPQCFPSTNQGLRIFVGIWAVFCGIIGFVGNLLTIIAIPYAAKKNQ